MYNIVTEYLIKIMNYNRYKGLQSDTSLRYDCGVSESYECTTNLHLQSWMFKLKV